MVLTLIGGLVSCGDGFLDTDVYSGVDLDTGLNSADNVSTALNGTYYRFYQYYFAGNYAVNIGDVVSDLCYWNGKNGHFNTLYEFSYSDTDTYLYYIWDYGYKVVDNSARIIQAVDNIYDGCTESEKIEMDRARAEAHALRAFANLYLVNVYGHQVKVDGKDYSSSKGIVISDEPIQALAQVSRSTVGETYDFILKDLNQALSYFDKVGDRGSKVYINKAAVYALLARTNLYLENWADAASNAQKAINESGISSLTYTSAGMQALYNDSSSNTESMFYLAITSTQNWSANSSGTLWSTYGMSPTPWLQSLYGSNDVRTAIMDMDSSSSSTTPEYAGGKYHHYSTDNSAYQTTYMLNAPEMYLIMAEAYLKQGNISDAQNALLTVAKRNLDITSTSDLPSSSSSLLQFIKDERARELFQEGHRLYDLRRWGEKANVDAYKSPDIAWGYSDYDIATLVFPIPVDEINAGFGVEQNTEWESVKPTGTGAIPDTWTLRYVGDYVYGDIVFSGDDPGLELYQNDNNPNEWKIEHWGYDVDFIFTYDESTGKVVVSDQYTGYDHSSYGQIYVCETTNWSDPDDPYETTPGTSYYEDGVFYFCVVYYCAYGWFGYSGDIYGSEWETFTLTSAASSAKAMSANKKGSSSKTVKKSLHIN